MNKEFEKRILDKYFFFGDKEWKEDMKISCLCWGFECDDGWQKLIEDLCEELNEHFIKYPNPDFRVAQVKSKFGGLRFYVQNEGEKYEEINSIIRKYEDMSYHTCEYCGADNAIQIGRWVMTLCPSCIEKSQK